MAYLGNANDPPKHAKRAGCRTWGRGCAGWRIGCRRSSTAASGICEYFEYLLDDIVLKGAWTGPRDPPPRVPVGLLGHTNSVSSSSSARVATAGSCESSDHKGIDFDSNERTPDRLILECRRSRSHSMSDMPHRAHSGRRLVGSQDRLIAAAWHEIHGSAARALQHCQIGVPADLYSSSGDCAVNWIRQRRHW